MSAARPASVAELRAAIAAGCRAAAQVHREAALEGLPGADQWAARLEASARRNDDLAVEAGSR